MTLWRRFVRWLSKIEIDKAYEAGSLGAQALAQQAASMERSHAFACGQKVGQDELCERMGEIIRERMHGADDIFVSPEDLSRAKKGLLH